MIRKTPQRFIGATTSDALKQVRQDIGADAIVLSTRDTPKGVEIIAISPAAIASMSGTASPPQIAPAPRPAQDSAQQEKLFTLLSEVKELIRSRVAASEWASISENDVDAAEALRMMLNAGFSEDVSGSVADEFKAQQSSRLTPLAERLQSLVEQRVRRVDALETFDQGGIFPLIGSTGVGKTTVAAKIAARCALRYGRDNVALLTTDTFRIGAQDQIRVYSRIIGIPMAAVSDSSDLANKLEEFSNRKVILVDTAGMGQRDLKMLEQIKLLKSGAQSAHHILVLSSTANLNTLEDVILMYSQALQADRDSQIHSVIITKTDEAAQIGPVLDCVMRHNLPLLFLANGQQVPEDLSPADVPYLVYRALHPRLVGQGLEYSSANVPLLMMDQLTAWAARRS
jgi:flagellar biosynthesis protein FlhF